MRKLLVVCALFCSVTFAQNADSSAISVDSAAVLESPSVHVDTSAVSAELKLSPLDHLGRNMLLSAFGWPLGFHLLGGVLTYKFSTENNDLMVARFAARQNKIAFGIAFMPGMMMGTFFRYLFPDIYTLSVTTNL